MTPSQKAAVAALRSAEERLLRSYGYRKVRPHKGSKNWHWRTPDGQGVMFQDSAINEVKFLLSRV